jgi:DNA polymerase-1
MKPLVLVDFSNFVYACWFPALAAQKADPIYNPHTVLKTNIKGKLGTLLRTLNDTLAFPDHDMLFVEDRTSERKYALYSAYKAKRVAQDFDPRPEAKQFLQSEGYRDFCHSPGNEADDAIATLVHRHKPNRVVVVCSSDKDLWQLYGANALIWQLTKDRFVNPDIIFEEFGVHDPRQIVMVKTLWGDSGDNVPNAVPRMQKHLMPTIEDTDGTLESFYRNMGNFFIKSERCKELLELGKNQIAINYQLVKLDTNCPIVLEVSDADQNPTG